MPRFLNELPSPAISLANGTAFHSSGYNSYDSSLDTNMVIILAALLCALICALGLNSMLRCAFHCSQQLVIQSSNEAAERVAATGLKKQALRGIPVAVYGSGAGIPATECPICLGEFVDGEKVRVLPKCGHGFHVRCIDTWLGSHLSCPTCRGSVIDRGGGGEAVEVAGEAVDGRRNEGVEVVVVSERVS